jgi:peptidyl-prolyl cis-trans isomerase C
VTVLLDQRPSSPPPVVISVNGTLIPRSAIAHEVQYHPASSPSSSWRQAAEALVLREILLQEARRQLPAPRPETDEKGRTETEEEALIRQLVEQDVQVPTPNEAELRRFYEANRTAFRSQELVEVRHILVSAHAADEATYAAAREKAEAIAAQLTAHPERFEALARVHSDCASSGEGGVLGQIAPGETTPEFEAALATLEGGQTTAAPAATRYGFHVIRLDRRIAGRQMPFEWVSGRIADYLVERARRTATAQYIARLVSRAEIRGIEIAGAEAYRVN